MNTLKVATDWKDYSVLATGDGLKLEDWAGIKLLRPDPQIIWKNKKNLSKEKEINARFIKSETGGGSWQAISKVPDSWQVKYNNLSFIVKLMGFKHTGIFPEQAVNWDKIMSLIKDRQAKEKNPMPIKALNLFAYTGAATVAAASAGAVVTHVDAAKGMVERAKENCKLNSIPFEKTRWIIDDCKKFLEKEIRRNNKYDAIIMDPPSYGRSESGGVWKLEEDLYDLCVLANSVLSKEPLFFLINSYTTGIGPIVMKNILNLAIQKKESLKIEAYELALKTKEEGVLLPCGNSALAIWS